MSKNKDWLNAKLQELTALLNEIDDAGYGVGLSGDTCALEIADSDVEAPFGEEEVIASVSWFPGDKEQWEVKS